MDSGNHLVGTIVGNHDDGEQETAALTEQKSAALSPCAMFMMLLPTVQMHVKPMLMRSPSKVGLSHADCPESRPIQNTVLMLEHIFSLNFQWPKHVICQAAQMRKVPDKNGREGLGALGINPDLLHTTT